MKNRSAKSVPDGINIVDLARLAAFIDGEGTIGIKTSNNIDCICFELRIAITNTDVRLMEWLRNTFVVGFIYTSDQRSSRVHKSAFRWECRSRQAEEIIRVIQPYLILKGEQAEIGLAFQALLVPRQYPRTRSIDECNQSGRVALVGKMRDFNARGKIA
jgi:hypothetical protein